jgi:hypothetical protein
MRAQNSYTLYKHKRDVPTILVPTVLDRVVDGFKPFKQPHQQLGNVLKMNYFALKMGCVVGRGSRIIHSAVRQLQFLNVQDLKL